MAVRTVNPLDVSVGHFHHLMLGAVAPRPIAFASTVDAEGRVNLSPYSFFNAFSANPPVLVFSPARRVRDNTTKHTLENLEATGEAVINIVNFPIVEQMSLASVEYDRGVNEFVKAGLTEVPSLRVRPPRVAEAPAAFECQVERIVPLGTEGGAGHLVVCRVLLLHVQEAVLNEKGGIDPHRIDLVARLGGDWYCRVTPESLFEVPKPNLKKGIGVDQIPAHIRDSNVLTGNDLGRLGNIEALPSVEALAAFRQTSNHPELADASEEVRHRVAQGYLRQGDVETAWKILLATSE